MSTYQSDREVLEETLWEYGLEPIKDEKSSSYLPVIQKFGGLYRAAEAFRGTSGKILVALAGGPKTVREILGICKLGDGTLPGESYQDRIKFLFDRKSERIKRVGKRRFEDYARRQAPENLKLISLLNHWTDRGIIVREWEVGPCTKCNRRSYVPAINLRQRVICPACGNRVSLPQAVSLGYSLQKHIKLAIDEGIVPVVLTGRFLKQMTHHGFFWIPGVKYRREAAHGDLDIVACCDGRLVFCECKQLSSTLEGADVWDEVFRQFLQTIQIAKTCKASLVVLAARVEEFPLPVQHRIAGEIAETIPYLLLTSKDLELGYRKVEKDKIRHNLNLSDLMPIQFPERPKEPTDKPKQIVMGWGTFNE